MIYTYKTKGTCSRNIVVDIDENSHVIRNVMFQGGCNGNTQGVAKLAQGRRAEDVIDTLRGIDCNGRGTSCPDQLANALTEAINS